MFDMEVGFHTGIMQAHPDTNPPLQTAAHQIAVGEGFHTARLQAPQGTNPPLHMNANYV